jgi:hypothetical protein
MADNPYRKPADGAEVEITTPPGSVFRIGRDNAMHGVDLSQRMTLSEMRKRAKERTASKVAVTLTPPPWPAEGVARVTWPPGSRFGVDVFFKRDPGIYYADFGGERTQASTLEMALQLVTERLAKLKPSAEPHR